MKKNQWHYTTVTLLALCLYGTFGCSDNEPKTSAEDLSSQIRKEKQVVKTTLRENQCLNKKVLFELIQTGETGKLAKQVTDYNCYIEKYNLIGVSILLDKPKVFEFLIDKVNEEKTVSPSVFAAAVSNKLKYIERLIQNGTDINILDINGNTLAKKAVCSSKNTNVETTLSILKFLSSNAGDITKPNYKGETPLHCAKSKSEVTYLINKGALVDAKTNHNWTPLHRAANNRKGEVAKALINNGANVNNQEGYNNWTAIFMAVDFGSIDIVRALVDSKADLSIRDKDGKTVLEFAKGKSHPNNEIIKLLAGSAS